ncbi:MAG: 50S ribosomal protein L25 [Anaerolineales bacterium]|jgi:large subunit ribosomal protein L25
MEEIIITAQKRAVIGKQVKALRRAGGLPAVIYGSGIKPTPILLNAREAGRTLGSISSSALVTLDVDGERHLALVRDRQRNFLMGTLNHVDFQVVSRTEKLRTGVSLEATGISPVVDNEEGILMTGLEELRVECYPQDLPEKIVVDISGLEKIGDAIYVKDVTPPANVEILEDPEETLFVITAPAAEEILEEAEVEEEGELGEPEVIERGKRDEDEKEE